MKKHSGLALAALGLLSLVPPSFAAAQAGQQTPLSDRKSGRYGRLPRPNGHTETDQEYRMRRIQELEQRLQPYINTGDRAAVLARRTLHNMRMDGNISDAEWAEAHEINRDFPQ